MKKPTETQLLAAIEEGRGNIAQIARHFKRPRTTVQSWIEANPKLASAVEDARETRIDDAEHAVYKAANADNLSAAFYILNNDPRARARGWGVQKHEISGPNGRAIEHKNASGGMVDVTTSAQFVASVLGILGAANALGGGSGEGDESAETGDTE